MQELLKTMRNKMMKLLGMQTNNELSNCSYEEACQLVDEICGNIKILEANKELALQLKASKATVVG